MKRERPLFSVIISCYNSGDYLDHMLTSLCHQGIRKDKLEVIISDDCSTISYDEVLDKYRKKLNIREIRADHNWGYPMHTREQGVSIATGEWITFADHDDAYYDNALKKVKKYIKKENPQYVMHTRVDIGYLKNGETKIIQENDTYGITHGMFFNLDNFWKKYDLHYNCDIKYHEDLYLNNVINTLEIYENVLIDDVDIKSYIWYRNPKSLGFFRSEPDPDGRFYLDKSFNYYIRATYEVICDAYIKYRDMGNENVKMDDFLEVSQTYITLLYIYYQALLCKNRLYDIEFDTSHDIALHNILQKYKSISLLSIDDYINTIDDDHFCKTATKSMDFLGTYHPIEGFEDWLRRLDALEV